jgi:hypothetical protein
MQPTLRLGEGVHADGARMHSGLIGAGKLLAG